MKTLADLLASGHPETAIVGVPLATLRAWSRQVPAVASTPVTPLAVAAMPSAAA